MDGHDARYSTNSRCSPIGRYFLCSCQVCLQIPAIKPIKISSDDVDVKILIHFFYVTLYTSEFYVLINRLENNFIPFNGFQVVAWHSDTYYMSSDIAIPCWH